MSFKRCSIIVLLVFFFFFMIYSLYLFSHNLLREKLKKKIGLALYLQIKCYFRKNKYFL